MQPNHDSIRVYRELAERYERDHNPAFRDLYLLLAADAAQSSGRPDEANRLRQRLVEANPAHFLSAFPTFGEAVANPDLRNYLNSVSQSYNIEQARALLGSLISSHDEIPETIAPTSASRLLGPGGIANLPASDHELRPASESVPPLRVFPPEADYPDNLEPTLPPDRIPRAPGSYPRRSAEPHSPPESTPRNASTDNRDISETIPPKARAGVRPKVPSIGEPPEVEGPSAVAQTIPPGRGMMAPRSPVAPPSGNAGMEVDENGPPAIQQTLPPGRGTKPVPVRPPGPSGLPPRQQPPQVSGAGGTLPVRNVSVPEPDSRPITSAGVSADPEGGKSESWVGVVLFVVLLAAALALIVYTLMP